MTDIRPQHQAGLLLGCLAAVILQHYVPHVTKELETFVPSVSRLPPLCNFVERGDTRVYVVVQGRIDQWHSTSEPIPYSHTL
ncbi:MAG: hypothetical protein ICV63_10865 [Coleofasciculus sp. Co-bin14]|nr:hypothetical protein [Coleofasciculus sp. Co-bin14]